MNAFGPNPPFRREEDFPKTTTIPEGWSTNSIHHSSRDKENLLPKTAAGLHPSLKMKASSREASTHSPSRIPYQTAGIYPPYNL